MAKQLNILIYIDNFQNRKLDFNFSVLTDPLPTFVTQVRVFCFQFSVLRSGKRKSKSEKSIF